MPSIAHLVLGALLGICLYYISDGKFTKTHVLILFFNNYYGPDAGYLCGLGTYTHTLMFWPIFALILTVIYHYFTKFTIKINGIKNIEIIELDEYKLSYLNTYFLVLAGGIMHIYLDGILNAAGVLMIIPPVGNYEGLYPMLEDLVIFWQEGALDISRPISLFVGISFIFGFVLVYIYFLTTISKRNLDKKVLIPILYIIAFIIFFYLAGWICTGVHPDAGAIIYVCLYWGAPLILCVLSTKEFQFLKGEKKVRVKSKEKAEIDLVIMNKYKIYYLIVGILAIIEGILLIIFNSNLINYLIQTEIFNSTHTTRLFQAFIFISIILMVIGILEIISGVYLGKENKTHNRNLLKVSIFLFIAGSIILVILAFLFFLNDVIIPYIFLEYGGVISQYFSYNDMLTFALIIEITFLIIALLDFICAFGLLLKNKNIWKFSVYYHLILGWTIFGLLAACFLSENSVKELFKIKE